jgi:hypothetical protein
MTYELQFGKLDDLHVKRGFPEDALIYMHGFHKIHSSLKAVTLTKLKLDRPGTETAGVPLQEENIFF